MTTRTLITGGAGFIGTNLAHALITRGEQVTILDDLSRPGVEANLHWLKSTHGARVDVEIGDVRDRQTLRHVVHDVQRVFHLAAQVAVTTSLEDPLHDFDVNLRGTALLLEELRRLETPPVLLYTSTNKVYGSLPEVTVQRRGKRYEPLDPRVRAAGIDESRSLHFCSPYGCSKGGADQYVLDYAATFGLPAMVFRMSCIYGLHQCGNEDQGWVAHFLRQTLLDQPITIYGDGGQVRDLLFVDDLVQAFLLAVANIDSLSGRAFNMGGGPANAMSLLELLDLILLQHGRRPEIEFRPWRAGDQRYYVSDTRAFAAATGWLPTVSPADGVDRLLDWLRRTAPQRALSPAV